LRVDGGSVLFIVGMKTWPDKSLQATRDGRSSSAMAEDIIRPASLGSGRWAIWQMMRQPSKNVAISPDPDAANSFSRQRKMLASSDFGKSSRCFIRIPLAFVIHE
jgi:hypothetical protein